VGAHQTQKVGWVGRVKNLMQLVVAVFVLSMPAMAADTQLPYDGTCPVIHTNDGDIDVYTLEYAMALASAGEIDLVGIIADAGTGYRAAPKANPMIWESGRQMYADIVGKARRSGMTNIPDPVAGANWALDRPASGRIEDTSPLDTPGSRLIVEQARKATQERPLVVVTGGALTCCADAYLLDNSIADRVVVAALLGRKDSMRCYNAQVDGWAAYIVLQRMRYVQFPAGQAVPRVPKTRLAGVELPDNELKRFMVDKDQQGVSLPGNGDVDVQPVISLMRPDYAIATRRVSFSHWIEATSWGNGYAKVPAFEDDPTGRAMVVTRADRDVATDEWWRALSSPAAYTGPVVQQAPFNGAPHTIPGVIEAEHFDWGGKGSAFDNSVPTAWPRCRVDASGLNLERCEDTGGGFNLTGAVPGDWYEYTVDVTSETRISVQARVASPQGGELLHVVFDGADAIGPLVAPDAGGVENWTTVDVGSVTLSAGRHVMRVVIDSSELKLNYLKFATDRQG